MAAISKSETKCKSDFTPVYMLEPFQQSLILDSSSYLSWCLREGAVAKACKIEVGHLLFIKKRWWLRALSAENTAATFPGGLHLLGLVIECKCKLPTIWIVDTAFECHCQNKFLVLHICFSCFWVRKASFHAVYIIVIGCLGKICGIRWKWRR